LFGRAVTMGWDPAGQTLSTAMPRYQIAPEDLADLTTYIQQLDQVADPGISQTLIRLGLTFPPDKSDGLATRAIHAPIASYVESLNRAGGIFRRRLELIPLDAGAVDGVPGASAAPSSGIFAALGGLSPDGDAASDSVDAADIPSVRVFPSPTSVGPTSPRKTFALLSGHAGQARALAAFAERHRIGFAARIAVVHGASAAGRALSAAIARQLRDAGANDVRVDALAAPDVDDPSSLELAHRLLERGTAAVLFVGPADPAGLGAFLSAIAERDARLILLVPAALLDAAPVDLPQPASLAGRLVVARPIVPEASLNRPGDVLSPADRGQLALFALKILVEGLKEAGRDLDRDSLQKALERFSSPPIGPIPSISFGPGRRVGRRGACILRLSRDARTFAVDTAWIDPGSSTDHWPAEAGERP